jgi:hypothetical protein
VRRITEYGHCDVAGGAEEDAYKRNPRERYECWVAWTVDAGTPWRNSNAVEAGR